jgi:hypothetical protein
MVFGVSATSLAGVKRNPAKKGIRNPMRGTAKKMIFFSMAAGSAVFICNSLSKNTQSGT